MKLREPAILINHIPKDFDMKRNQRKRPLSQRRQAQIEQAKARHIVEPSSFEEHQEEPQPFIWKLVAFAGALGVVAAALITGVWHR